jgi:hypothetical protein
MWVYISYNILSLEKGKKEIMMQMISHNHKTDSPTIYIQKPNKTFQKEKEKEKQNTRQAQICLAKSLSF